MEKLKELFERIGKQVSNDKHDYISELISYIPTTNQARFKEVFKEWIIASVANVFIEHTNTNPKCIVLCGGQGTNKTAFTSIFFKDTHTYIGRLYPDSMDDLISLTETFLIALDGQYLGENQEQKEIEWLRSMVLMEKVQARFPYEEQRTSRPRISNFIATTNLESTEIVKESILVPFDLVGSIDIESISKMDLSKVWGQAYNLHMTK